LTTSPTSPRAILIDLDGTLADSLSVMRVAYQQFLEGFQVQGTDDEFASLNGPPLHEVVRRLKANHSLAGDTAALTAKYFHIIDQLYDGVVPSLGARELLTKANEHGCRVCIVTSNSTKRTRAWLALVGLEQCVDFIVSGDEVTFGKPHPEPYLLATQRVDCPITGIVAVEACFKAGMVKNTYGTGCFMLMHTGGNFQTSHNGLITTSAAQTAPTPEFAIEGSVFVGGAVVQWLRDGLHAIQASGEVQALAQSVPDSGGVIVVPAFTGLGAPYWKPDARGTITGLTRGTSVAHIARAALESIAYQSAALLQAMGRDVADVGGATVSELRVDGGACINDLLMQFQADLLGIPVVRPAVIETTALGAAYLAGLTVGVYQNTDELTDLWRSERRFLPTLDRPRAQELMERWEHAVRQTVL
jgi:beta-phosphoglucomutase-like phosphatase (HAD superfamily)